jgi:hypothetical protein
VRLYISARKLNVPRICACCGAPPDAEMDAKHTRTTGKRVIREQTRSWTFPYCLQCIRHVEMWRNVGTVAAWTMLLAVVVAVALAKASGGVAAAISFVLFAAIATAATARRRAKVRASLSPSCAVPEPAVHYLGWDGSVQGFDIASRDFAASLAQANQRALVNISPELRALLERPAQDGRRSSETPRIAEADSVRPAPSISSRDEEKADRDRALEWIGKIESFKGPVARRNALVRALGEIENPSVRHQVVVAASKIEVSATLDKVDALTTQAAKRRHLEKALADLASDEISDDLQAEEYRLLRQALDGLR